MFILLRNKQMGSHCPFKDLWLSLQTELLAGRRHIFPWNAYLQRKVAKECDCRKPSLYICHGNSSFKKQSDGRNINYHSSLISAECSYSKLAKSRLLLVQLDRPSSFISWVMMGHFWLLLLKRPRFPLLYPRNIRNEVERVKKGSHLTPHSHHFFCEARSSLDAYFIHTFVSLHSSRSTQCKEGKGLLWTSPCPKQFRPNYGILLLEAFCFIHTRRNLTLQALPGSKKA